MRGLKEVVQLSYIERIERNHREEEERREKQGRGYRIATVVDFYMVLRLFFIRLVFVFKDSNMIYGPLGVLSIGL